MKIKELKKILELYNEELDVYISDPVIKLSILERHMVNVNDNMMALVIKSDEVYK